MPLECGARWELEPAGASNSGSSGYPGDGKNPTSAEQLRGTQVRATGVAFLWGRWTAIANCFRPRCRNHWLAGSTVFASIRSPWPWSQKCGGPIWTRTTGFGKPPASGTTPPAQACPKAPADARLCKRQSLFCTKRQRMTLTKRSWRIWCSTFIGSTRSSRAASVGLQEAAIAQDVIASPLVREEPLILADPLLRTGLLGIRSFALPVRAGALLCPVLIFAGTSCFRQLPAAQGLCVRPERLC
jgi:hypothetical protein